MSHLDLIISVDTSVVHLAGALGKPVWVMLPLVPGYCWMLRAGRFAVVSDDALVSQSDQE